jgi:hypothetical protein
VYLPRTLWDTFAILILWFFSVLVFRRINKYLDGLGVPKDYVQAYMWFRLTNSETNLSYAKARMTPAEILEAERMAAEWKASHPER